MVRPVGKVENCQVGVYMGYVSRKEHALVNMRLYLPKEWAKARARRKAAGVSVFGRVKE
jgi:SRSO17 transposase